MRRIVLYGCGYYYSKVKDIIKKAEEEGRFEVVGISARDLPSEKTMDGWRLIPCNALLEESFDSILIMSEMHDEEIRAELMAQGVSSKAFDYHFCPEYWDTSINGISILSNLCWGGIAAHTLGIECCSPTKDLWISESEFLKLLKNLNFYLSLDPVFVGWAEADGRFDAARYPLLAIGDIVLHCNHDTDPEKAYEKWQRRKTKINYENLIAVLITENPELEKQFYQLDNITKKYCLVPWKSSYRHSILVERVDGIQWTETAVGTAYPGGYLDLAAMMYGHDNVIVKGHYK